MSIGVNILAQTVHDRARMYDWLLRAQPKLIVVCDEPDVAARCKMIVPGAIVAHRHIYEGDSSIGLYTPQEWAARYVENQPDNTASYCLNEPSGDWRAISQWCADVMSIAAVANKPLIVGNLSVGNPPEAAIAAGDFDALLLAFNDFPLHYFGLHEYWISNPTAETYRVGRYKALQDRAATIGARAVRFVMTEAGRDVNGGSDDGWQSVMDAQTYADKLTQQANVYRADAIPMAVFCYGTGGSGAWASFDIQDAPPVLEAITTYNTQEADVYIGPPGWVQAETKAPGVNVNVRSGAGITYAPISTVKTGDWVKPSGAPVKNGAYTWQKISLEDCRTGWVATEVIEV